MQLARALSGRTLIKIVGFSLLMHLICQRRLLLAAAIYSILNLKISYFVLVLLHLLRVF